MIPHDPHAERDVVGAMLLASDLRSQALDVLDVDDFHDPRLGAVFAAIRTIHERAGKVDVTTVADECARRTVEVTRSDLATIQAQVPASANVGDYARIVAEYATLRRAIGLSVELRDAAETLDLDAVEQILAHAADRVDNPRRTVEPATEARAFLAARPEVEPWLIDGVLRRRERVMLTGGEGHGKSLLLLQLAVMLASGVHPFDLSEIPPRRVLLVDCENEYDEVADRLEKLLLKAGSRYAGTLWIEGREQGIDVRRRNDRGWFEALVAAHDPEVLVVGPVYKLIEGDEKIRSDSAEAASIVARVVDRVRVRHDCAVILEHHAPHGDRGDRAGFRPFGSSLWLRWVNFGIGLKVRPDEVAEIEHWKPSRSRGRRWPDELVPGAVGSWPWEARYR